MGIGFSVFLIALGAVLTFAVEVQDSVISGLVVRWDTVGVILMIVGVIGLIWSAYLMSTARSNRTVVDRDPRDEIRM